MLLLRENSYPKDERICPIALKALRGVQSYHCGEFFTNVRTDIRYVRSMSELELDMVNYGGGETGSMYILSY